MTFKTDLLNALRPVPVSFHVPGHKYGRFSLDHGDVFQWDTTEIPGTDNLHHSEGIIRDAQDRARNTYGSLETFFLVNGTTGGILAALMAVLEPGDGVLIGRDCHQSVYHGAWLAYAVLRFVQPQYREEDLLNLGIAPEAIRAEFEKDPNIRAVVLTCPTYFGICSDIRSIADICHRYGAVLIVDEAHGAHFGATDRLPEPALIQGADLVVQSTHKTLTALTQSSMLHVGSERVELEKLKWMLRIFQSSSPSYVLMASLDEAVRFFKEEGTRRLETLLDQIDRMDARLCQEGIHLLNRKIIGVGSVKDYDPTRIVLSAHDFGIHGEELSEMLRETAGIQMEMSTPWQSVGVATLATTEEDLRTLESALIELKREKRLERWAMAPRAPKLPTAQMVWREATDYAGVDIEIRNSIGRIARQMVVPYPPGAPVLVPGEIITEEIAAYIGQCRDCGISVIGLTGQKCDRIQVVER